MTSSLVRNVTGNYEKPSSAFIISAACSMILDEPFSALDYPTRKALLNEMGELLRSMNMTALFVTHDYTEIPYLATYVCVLFDGKIVKRGTVREVFGESLSQRQCMVPWEES